MPYYNKFILILPIKIYQIVISPLFPGSCRFDPTCSHYMIKALKIGDHLRVCG